MSGYTGPTGVTLNDKEIHVEGYPDARRVAVLPGKLAKRLADLRMHQQTLLRAKAVLDAYGEPSAPQDVLRRAALQGVVEAYFSCFAENRASAPLSAKAVFNGDGNALEGHRWWKNWRNKHLSHNESMATQGATCLVLGAGDEVMDILSLSFSASVFDEDHVRLLFSLVTSALEAVEKFANDVLAALWVEVRKLTSDQIGKMKEFQYHALVGSELHASRTYPSP